MDGGTDLGYHFGLSGETRGPQVIVTENGTERPVDGVFCPLAPFAAAKPNQFRYPVYTAFVNVLNYTSVTIPL